MYSNVIKIYCRHMYIYFTLKWGFNNSKNIYGNHLIIMCIYIQILENYIKRRENSNNEQLAWKEKNNLKIAIRNCRGLVREGQKKWNPSGQEPSEVLCWKISKVIKKIWTKYPLKCNQEPKYVITKKICYNSRTNWNSKLVSRTAMKHKEPFVTK